MATLLEQLQRDCIDPKVPVSMLLLQVKLAANKLGIAQAEEWVDKEINGYKDNVPSYRIVRGSPMASTSSRPVRLQNAENISIRHVPNSIASLESLIASGPGPHRMEFPDKVAQALRKANRNKADYFVAISSSALAHIIQSVRAMIVDWTTELEKVGITGSEFSFTEGDKRKAQSPSVNINIGSIEHFAGNLGQGNVSGSIATSAIDVEAIRELLSELRQHAPALAQAQINTTPAAAIEAELKKSKPDHSILRGLLTDLRNAVSGAAGNLIASGILFNVQAILGG
jgi:hypothetical protein